MKQHSTEFYNKNLERLAAKGYRMSDVADLAGASVRAIRAAKDRRDIEFVQARSADFRSLILDMKPLEAVEYLLGAVEILQTLGLHEKCFEQPLACFGIEMTQKTLRRAMRVLAAAAPRYVTKETILDAIYFDLPPGEDGRSDQNVNVTIVKLRKLIRKSPHEIGEIENVWGIGYRFIPADMEKWERWRAGELNCRHSPAPTQGHAKSKGD